MLLSLSLSLVLSLSLSLPPPTPKLTADKSTIGLVQLGVGLLEEGNPELVAVAGESKDRLGLLRVARVDRDPGVHDDVDPFGVFLETADHDPVLLVLLKLPEHLVQEVVARGKDRDRAEEPAVAELSLAHVVGAASAREELALLAKDAVDAVLVALERVAGGRLLVLVERAIPADLVFGGGSM